MNTQISRTFFNFLGRVVTVGVVYTATLIVVGSGLAPFTQEAFRGNDPPTLLWTFIGSLIMALAVGLVAEELSASRTRHLLIWTTLLFGNVASVIIEGAIFNPDLLPDVPLLLVQQFLACVVTADVVYYFFAPTNMVKPERAHHHWLGWLGRFAAASLAYIVFYYAFGAINYSLMTQPYYTPQINGLTIPEPHIVLLAQLIRGPIVILSLLPLLLTLHTLPHRLLVITGMLLFVVGGVVPWLWQINQLPTVLFLASGLEIFAQFFATGAVAAWLLGDHEVSHEPTPHLKNA